MRNRVLMTSFLVLCFILMLSWPWFVGPRPKVNPVPKAVTSNEAVGRSATNKELARYAIRVLCYVGATSTSFLLAALFASLAVRQAKREFLEAEKQNLRGLVEGSLRDHEKRES